MPFLQNCDRIEKEGDFDETEDGEDTESSPVKNTQTTHGVQRRNHGFIPISKTINLQIGMFFLQLFYLAL